MKIPLIVLFLVCTWGRAQAQPGPLVFSDVSRWGSWRGNITSFDLKATVDGLVSRNVLTLGFQDFQADQSDSLEMGYSFTLPKGSVVDSLYLWIGEKKQPAALKSIWTAWQIYGSIVRRRWDPALLTTTGNSNYYLRVFPFSRGQTRRVQICYTTPLAAVFDRLRMEVPLQLTTVSAQPVATVDADIRFIGIDTARLAVTGGKTSAWRKTEGRGEARLTFHSDGNAFSEAAYVQIEHSVYAQEGMAVQFEADDKGETHFIALMNPRKALGLPTAKKKRKLLVLWNLVGSYPRYAYSGSGVKYDGTQYQYYYQPSILQEGRDIADFLQSTLASGDEMNFMFNDLAIKRLGTGMAGVDLTTFSGLRGFIEENLSRNTQSDSSGAKSAADLLAAGLSSLKGIPNAELLLIDRYSQAYWWDTTYSDGVDGKALLALAPDSLTAYVVTQTASTGGNTRPTNLANAYQSLARGTGGTLLNSGYAYYPIGPVLEGLKPVFSNRIYPASLSFSVGASGFAYDVFGVPELFYLDQDLVVMGKLSIPATLPLPGFGTDPLTVRFQAKSEGRDLNLTKAFPISLSTTGSYLPGLWGARKVESILGNGYYSPTLWQEATDWSLRYRILTPVTALLALEEGLFDSSWYQDQQASNNPNLPNRLEAPSEKGKGKLAVAVEPGFLVLGLEGLSSGKDAHDLSVQIFDSRGRLMADLTADAKKSGPILRWSTRALPKGAYAVKVRAGGKFLARTFSVR